MHRSVLMIVLLFASQLAATAVAETNPFLEAGIPATTRTWSGPDYERTAEILTAGKVALPKVSDPRGAALLQRRGGVRLSPDTKPPSKETQPSPHRTERRLRRLRRDRECRR